MSAALAAAGRAKGPLYTPMWLALLAMLLAVFTPMVLVTFVRARRRTDDA
jgi:hypothetical protein